MEIDVGRGRVALIDAADHGIVAGHKWTAQRGGGGSGPYAMSTMKIGTRKTGRRSTSFYMHRVILGLERGDPDVDHVNGDGLDNRRANLRLATNSQNQANRKLLEGRNRSGYRGVTYHKRAARWQAAVKYLGRSLYLGLFDSAADAARAYDAKAREVFGEYANLNFGSRGA